MEILYQSGVDRMDIPRGEIMVESPLEFVDLKGVLQKFKDKGYLEILLMEKEIEEGYIFIENQSILGVFYEGHREGEPLQNVRELLREKPAVILHKLTETQLDVLKEFYPLDKKYGMETLFGVIEVAKPKEKAVTKKETEEVRAKPVAKSQKTEAKRRELGGWESEVPIISKSGITTTVEKEEFLENINPFARNILKYVDGKMTIGEIIEKSGETPEDVMGIIQPYKRTGFIKFKK